MRERAVDLRRCALPYGPGSVRRRGFTIIELIVSIGLLALMMSLAGKVFSISVASTGQATALIEVSQSFRLLGATLRDDLRSINPERSMLVIAANPINAYWTAEGRELDSPANSGDSNPANGYLHDPDPEREYVNGDMVPPRADVLMTFTSRKAHSVRYPSIWSNIVQVVYGHAELGELDSSANWTTGPIQFPTDGSPFLVPAETWHLARRMVLGVDAQEDDVAARADPNDPGLTFPDSPDAQDLVDGITDIIAKKPAGDFFFTNDVIETVNPPAVLWYGRSVMDVTPPAPLAHRLGHYFLPKCASFTVEWTISGKYGLTGPTIVWHDPADALVPGADPYDELNGTAFQFEFQRRFMNGANGLDVIAAGSPVWYASDPTSPSNSDPFWPTALRITVDVYDDAGRLSRPTRHVFILPIGEG